MNRLILVILITVNFISADRVLHASVTQADDYEELQGLFNSKSQLIKLSAIEDHTPFTSRTVNGTTYTRVTLAMPLTETIYPVTHFDHAYYDQKAGFIEIIGLNGELLASAVNASDNLVAT